MLPSVPIFTLAGYFLAEGKASKRLVRVFQALVGQFRGGPAIVTALVCAFFTSFTGASGVTILALGGVLMPVLLAARYSERNALGLLTGAGSLGMLFPPCLPLILYTIVANHSAHADLTIKEMFLGGIGPGVLLVALTAWWGIRKGPKEAVDRPVFHWPEAGAALWDAKWEMLIPVVAIVSLFYVPTTVEAAAVTATYALLVTTVIHRDLRPIKDLPRHRVRIVGRRGVADPGRRARLHSLPGGCAVSRQDGRVGHPDGGLEMAIPAGTERGVAVRGRPG
jgi:tripartite ATP-independent transporter DctM subunit